MATKQDFLSKPARRRDMKVLVLGKPRTGTTSLAAALRCLGFHPYDFEDRYDLGHLGDWAQALRAKYANEGKRWGRKEFDALTGDFDCVLDSPMNLFVDELVQAYPEAKIILSTRDIDGWVKSMTTNIITDEFNWPSWRILRYTDRQYFGAAVELDRALDMAYGYEGGDPEELLREKFLENHQLVKKVAPTNMLLEYPLGAGWKPLCQFLNVPVPEEPYPWKNDKGFFRTTMVRRWNDSVLRSVKNIFYTLCVFVPVIVCVRYTVTYEWFLKPLGWVSRAAG